VASGVGVSLSTCTHILDRGAQAGAQAAACGDPTLPQQEKITWEISRRAAFFNTPTFTDVAASFHLSTFPTQFGILLPVFRALVFGLALCFGESINLT
jgi:hypothetical protein